MNTCFRFTIALVVLAIVQAHSQDAVKPAAPRPIAPGAVASPVKFVTHRLNQFRSEALGVADFNRDGKLDIVAGAFLYLAPDFKPTKIRTLSGSVDDQGKGYMDDFMRQRGNSISLMIRGVRRTALHSLTSTSTACPIS